MNIDPILQSKKKDTILARKKDLKIKAGKFLVQAHMNSKMLCLNMDLKYNQAMDLDLGWL